MNTYDVTYITAHIDEKLEERLLDQFDELNVGRHSGLQFVMTTLTTDDLQTAATEFARALEDAGVRVERMDLDLVNQAEIASRCGVSRQAVSKWVATQSVTNPFPAVYTLAGGPLWAWSSVNEWLRCTAKPRYDDSCSPPPNQVTAFNSSWGRRPSVAVESVPYGEIGTVMVGRLLGGFHWRLGINGVDEWQTLKS